jgi:GAF domain-containing protein
MAGTMVSAKLQELFRSARDHDKLFAALMPEISRELDCGRCLLFLRDPDSWQSACTHGWWDRPEHGFGRDKSWRKQSQELAMKDPMFAEALHNPVALFIDDIETADPKLVNRDYEAREFKHRALIHAPLFHKGKCYGILEPCVFGRARAWSKRDREVTAWLQERMGAPAAEYVAAHAPRG